MTVTEDEFEALMDEAAGLAAATVGYPSPLFVTQAQFQLQRLITERNITEIAHEAHHDQAVH
mgnify:FL=1|jgi:hypothetical protein